MAFRIATIRDECSDAVVSSTCGGDFEPVTVPEDHVFVPNQSVLSVPASTALSPGDWVFFHPRQADAMFQFEQIRRVRGGRLEDTAMAPYPRRY